LTVRWIFFDQAAKGLAIFSRRPWSSARWHGDDRLGEGRRFELDVVVLNAKRVARLDVRMRRWRDITGINRFDFLALVGLDLDDALMRSRLLVRDYRPWCPCELAE